MSELMYVSDIMLIILSVIIILIVQKNHEKESNTQSKHILNVSKMLFIFVISLILFNYNQIEKLDFLIFTLLLFQMIMIFLVINLSRHIKENKINEKIIKIKELPNTYINKILIYYLESLMEN